MSEISEYMSIDIYQYIININWHVK